MNKKNKKKKKKKKNGILVKFSFSRCTPSRTIVIHTYAYTKQNQSNTNYFIYYLIHYCNNYHISLFIIYYINYLIFFREDEEKRIKSLGGEVIHWGRWRVQGVLAVSRYVQAVQ